MRHNVDGRKLGRNATHRRALYRNLVIALITHERIRTTTAKAKEARRVAERMITFAKRGDLHARRHVASLLNDKKAVQKLFDELGPRYATRAGGYTRVLKLSGVRAGDSAEMALLEFVKDGDRPKKKRASSKVTAKAKGKKSKTKSKTKTKSKVEAKPASETEAASSSKKKTTAKKTTAKKAAKKKTTKKKTTKKAAEAQETSPAAAKGESAEPEDTASSASAKDEDSTASTEDKPKGA